MDTPSPTCLAARHRLHRPGRSATIRLGVPAVPAHVDLVSTAGRAAHHRLLHRPGRRSAYDGLRRTARRWRRCLHTTAHQGWSAKPLGHWSRPRPQCTQYQQLLLSRGTRAHPPWGTRAHPPWGTRGGCRGSYSRPHAVASAQTDRAYRYAAGRTQAWTSSAMLGRTMAAPAAAQVINTAADTGRLAAAGRPAAAPARHVVVAASHVDTSTHYETASTPRDADQFNPSEGNGARQTFAAKTAHATPAPPLPLPLTARRDGAPDRAACPCPRRLGAAGPRTAPLTLPPPRRCRCC